MRRKSKALGGRLLPPGSLAGPRWGLFTWQRRSSVGIDLGDGYLRICQISRGPDGARLVNYAVVPLSSTLPDAAARTLREVCRALNIRQASAGVALPSESTITRWVEMPPASQEELALAMRYEAPQHLPFPEDDLVYDFTPVPEAEPESAEKVPVLLIGAQKKVIQEQQGLLRRAGVHPEAIEPDALCAVRALRLLQLLPTGRGQTFGLIDVGEQGTRITLYRYRLPVQARTAAVGLADLRQTLQDDAGLSPEAAMERLWQEGFGGQGLAARHGAAWLRHLADAVVSSVQYFAIQQREVRVSRLLLVGSGALLPQLRDALAALISEQLGEDGPALRLPVLDPAMVHDRLLPHVLPAGPLLLGALGAAMRKDVTP